MNDTYPWNAAALQQEGQSLLQLRPEDVGYDGYSSSKEGTSSKQVSQSDTEGDPLVRTSPQFLATEANLEGRRQYEQLAL